MECIFLGKMDLATFDPRSISLSFRTKHLDQHVEVRKELDYDCDYVLVKADDVITTNDEILKLRDEVKRLTDECADWKARYAKANNYITCVEKGCESLREDRDMWKRKCGSVITDTFRILSGHPFGVKFDFDGFDERGNWLITMDLSGAIDSTSISCGTVPKCSSCAHYMHNPSRSADVWCHKPVSKEGPGTIRRLSTEEAEGPACSDFKARKEDDCKDCKYHIDGSWRSRKDGKAMAECKSPSTRYGFCKNNCNGEKACPEFEAKE